jgi:hypothetical protein
MHRSVRRVLRSAAAAVAVAASLSLVAAGGTPASASSSAIPRFKMPKVYGTQFQADPHHDFTKRIHSRHNGILRGWVNYYSAGVADYEPIRWVSGKEGEDGFFVSPEEGVVSGYQSPVSSKAVLYSTSGCKIPGTRVTIDDRGLGTQRCSKKALIAHLKAGHRAAMITVYRGEIVKIQEISTG